MKYKKHYTFFIRTLTLLKNRKKTTYYLFISCRELKYIYRPKKKGAIDMRLSLCSMLYTASSNTIANLHIL